MKQLKPETIGRLIAMGCPYVSAMHSEYDVLMNQNNIGKIIDWIKNNFNLFIETTCTISNGDIKIKTEVIETVSSNETNTNFFTVDGNDFADLLTDAIDNIVSIIYKPNGDDGNHVNFIMDGSILR